MRIFGATNCQFKNMNTVRPTADQAEKSPVVKIRAGYPKKSQLLMSLAWAERAVSQKLSDRLPRRKSLSDLCFLYESVATSRRIKKYPKNVPISRKTAPKLI